MPQPPAPSPSAAGQPGPPLRVYGPLLVPVLLGLIASLWLAGWFGKEAGKSDDARFLLLAHQAGEHIESRIEAAETMLRGLARELSRLPQPSLQVWEEFMNQVSPQWNYPPLLAIGYATNTTTPHSLSLLDRWSAGADGRNPDQFYRLPEELAGDKAWTTWMLDVYRPDLFPLESTFREQTTQTSIEGSFHRRRYHQATAVSQTAPNPFHYGDVNGVQQLYEMLPEHFWLHHAIFRDDVKITGRQAALRDLQGEEILTASLLVPVYHPRRSDLWKALPPHPDRVFEACWLRWHLQQGYLFAPLDFPRLISMALGPGPSPLRIEIHAAVPEKASQSSWLNPDGQPLRTGDASFRPRRKHTHSWPMYGTRWTIFLHTTPVFDADSTRYRAYWAIGLGLIITSLFAWALGIQLRGRWQDQEQALRLREARDALQGAQQERERLNADLHDGTIQSLYAIQLGLTDTARTVGQENPEAGRRLSESRQQLDGVIAELRRCFNPGWQGSPDSSPVRLGQAVRAILDDFTPGTDATLDAQTSPAAEARLSAHQTLQLATIARTAVANCLRHARARHIQLHLHLDGDQVRFDISDDGIGFDPAVASRTGLGLHTMQRRARHLGASFHLQTQPGHGTRVRITLPVPVAPPPPARAPGLVVASPDPSASLESPF
ncbi:MAG: sensor histidine kinase [Verrucomicrobiae bacterium]|nr:sensor histidine kinase [Verrucomicrobiae bacterium]